MQIVFLGYLRMLSDFSHVTGWSSHVEWSLMFSVRADLNDTSPVCVEARVPTAPENVLLVWFWPEFRELA